MCGLRQNIEYRQVGSLVTFFSEQIVSSDGRRKIEILSCYAPNGAIRVNRVLSLVEVYFAVRGLDKSWAVSPTIIFSLVLFLTWALFGS